MSRISINYFCQAGICAAFLEFVADPDTILSLLRRASPIVFVNPRAGRGRASSYIGRIKELFRSYEIAVEVRLTGSAEELRSVAAKVLSEGHKVVFAMGGDGTAQALANVTYRSDAILGLLPAGGGNDFAAAAGIPIDPLRAAEALVHGQIRRVDLVRASTADGRVHLYLGGGGVGLDAEAARLAASKYRSLPGRIRYLASALHAFARYQPIGVRLEFPGSDDRAYGAEALVAAVLSTPTYGGGLRLAPGARVDDGWLHVVLLEDLSALGVLKLLPRLAASGELRTDRVKRWRVKRVKLSTDRPCLLHGDGEGLGATPVEIEILPQALQLLAIGGAACGGYQAKTL